jgi:hypothetical protein
MTESDKDFNLRNNFGFKTEDEFFQYVEEIARRSYENGWKKCAEKAGLDIPIEQPEDFNYPDVDEHGN